MYSWAIMACQICIRIHCNRVQGKYGITVEMEDELCTYLDARPVHHVT